MTNFKTPSRAMAAVIALVLLALFGAVLLTPMIWPEKHVEFDPALVQTLLTLTVIAVGYYLGTSSNSQAKDDTIVAQAKAAVAPPPLGSGPTGTPSDPVSVTEAKP